MEKLIDIKKMMTRFLLSAFVLLTAFDGIAQSRMTTYTARYESSSSIKSNNNKDQVMQTFQHYDGLGRIVQSIVRSGVPDSYGNRDLVTAQSYDVIGRPDKSYLTYAKNANNGAYVSNVESEVLSFYQSNSNDVVNDPAPYSVIVYEASPLNRVAQQGAPGIDWQPDATNPSAANSTKFGYLTNINGDGTSQERITIWEVNEDLITNEGYYGSGKLKINTTTDPDGNVVRTYMDNAGRIILKKVAVSTSAQVNVLTDWALTYYIHDDRGNLRFILPPEASKEVITNGSIGNIPSEYTFLNANQEVTTNGKYMYSPGVTITIEPGATLQPLTEIKPFATDVQIIDDLVFQYKYDNRNRVIAKKFPGADWVYMVYDKWDRLVLIQDGNQRANGQWLFTAYDRLNRPAITGLLSDSRAHNTMIGYVQPIGLGDTYRFLTYDGSGSYGYNSTAYPFNNAGPATIDEILTVTYYDDHQFLQHSVWSGTDFSFNDPENQLTNYDRTHGLITGSLVRVNDGSWIKSVNYHDHKYRLIQTQFEHHLGGKNVSTNYYDFIGQVVKVIDLNDDGSSTTKITRWLDYDHIGRLMTIHHQIGNNAANKRLIVSNSYNEIGELVQKDLHNGAQQVDYSYNIRGWLKSINDSQRSDAGDVFGMELHYNTNAIDQSNKLFNGNIAGVRWSDVSTNHQRSYNYEYDGLNRLLSADHYFNGSNTNSYDVNNIQYDLNGNILTLDRRGKTTNNYMDDLLYTYAGNQLQNVDDSGDDALGFTESGSGTDYTYDKNGNMISDANKGVTEIDYNHLNLPVRVTFDSQNYITYLYDAAGIKLQQKVYSNGSLAKTIDYVGEFVYLDGSLQLIHHEEGRAVSKDGSWVYQYHLKDHLGNVRATFSTISENYTMVETFETGDNNGWQDLHRFTSSNANTTVGGDEVERLQIGETGAMVFLSVNKGDTLNLSINANYEAAPAGNTFAGTAFSTLFTSFDDAYGSGAENGVSVTNTPFGNALNGSDMGGKDDNNNAPRAFLNYIFFDKDMNYVSAGFQQISTAALGVGIHERISINNRIPETDGYLLAYLSNENQEVVNVHFDDFSVYHGKTNVVSSQDYYPFGLTFNQGEKAGSIEQNYKFNGQETDKELKTYSYEFRMYDPMIGRWWQTDPLIKEHESPYVGMSNNPVRFMDVSGLDTVDINYNEDGIWEITNTQIVEGDDVFRITRDGETSTHTFSEGEYGARIVMLNLENTDEHTLGVYHISGERMDLGRTGYFVTPGGDYDNQVGSNARIAPDVYDLTASPTTASWRQIWVTNGELHGDISQRGIKFHFSGSTPADWTEGCFLLCSNYSKSGNTVKFDFDQSRTAVALMDFHMGATDIYKYMDQKYNGRGRLGATFPSNNLPYKLILKDGF